MVDKEIDIVPTALAVKAMRDNGYKNAAYAIAELIDNSIQAGAKDVQLICSDIETKLDQRVRQRIHAIGILDNGCGMDTDTLQIALQFGNGTRLDEENQTGMGRFGMGLPSASISQCRRVDVWSWTTSISNALHTYIDLDEVANGTLNTLPAPRRSEVPRQWLDAAGSEAEYKKSGTLVVWSNLDRVFWRTSKALIGNSEFLIGRMYRKWISEDSVRIHLRSFRDGSPGMLVHDAKARATDPGYLITDTTCPEPFSKTPMFTPFPDKDSYEIETKIRFRGKDHSVFTRLSLATPEAREAGPNGQQAGNMPHGKHAARNIGVSVVRAGRELELDPAWANVADARERWWGVEVSFEPGLDELFGVSNNKQSARNFAEAAKVDVQALIKEHGGSLSAARQALADDEDPIEPLLEIVHRVQSNISVMRNLIKNQGENAKRRRHGGSGPSDIATTVVRERQKKGHKGVSDDGEAKPLNERKADLKAGLVADGHSESEAEQLAASTIDKGLKYQIDVAEMEGGAFFSVRPKGGVLLVTLNSDHPAYDLLLGARNPSDLPDDGDALKQRLIAAQSGLEMMLFAWARYEDEQTPEDRRNTQNVRYDWGRMAEAFLDRG